jgi:sulfate transport system ATP-binding protein
MSIEINNIRKTFDDFVALHDVDLHVRPGELVALLGPSGSGKTTLLRIISGLEEPDAGSGSIRFEGREMADRDARLRGVGFVFQHYALFRHMTVFENVAFGLSVRPRRQRPSKAVIHERVHELLRLVQLEGLARRYPSQLSGGQRQRVALARALAIEPQVLLLDEPFGALDAKVRAELRRWLRRLHDEIHVTSVFVTHDQDEALELADRVVVMNQGRIEQIGTPAEVFNRPATEFVMDFLGTVNRFSGRVDDGVVHFADLALEAPDHKGAQAEPARVFVRPHELEVGLRPTNGRASFPATVVRVHAAGNNVRLELATTSGEPVHVEVEQAAYERLAIDRGHTVFASPKSFRVFRESTGETTTVTAPTTDGALNGAGGHA